MILRYTGLWDKSGEGVLKVAQGMWDGGLKEHLLLFLTGIVRVVSVFQTGGASMIVGQCFIVHTVARLVMVQYVHIAL